MATSIATNLGLVPHRRLGTLLAERRELYGCSLEDMARRSMGRFTDAELRSIESGQVTLDDAAVEALSLVYEFNSAPVSQQRSKLIIADDEQLPVPLAPEDFDEALVLSVLRRYVALLYLLRNKSVGDTLPLRGDDTEVLATVFQLDEAEIVDILERIMEHDSEIVGEQADRMRRRLVVPAAGLLVGPTPAGMLVLVK